MSSGWRWSAILSLGLAVGCGGATRRSEPTPRAPAASAKTLAAPLSPALASVGRDADFVLRIDGHNLRQSPLFGLLLANSRRLPGSGKLAAIDQKCGFPLLDAIDEVVLSGKLQAGPGRPHLRNALVAVALNRAPEDGVHCIAAVAGDARQAEIDGRAAMQIDVDEYVAAEGKLVLAGSRRALRGGIARVQRGGEALPVDLRTRLSKNLDADLFARAVLPEALPVPVQSAELTLRSDAAHFALRLSVNATSERAARRLADLAGRLRARLAQGASAIHDPKVAQAARALVQTITTDAQGRTAVAEFDVQGDARAQALRVGAVAALAIAGVRRYIARAKSAEARILVHVVTDRLVAYLKTEPAARRRMPPSAPRTPAEVPKGKPVVVQSNAWTGSWKTIHFTPSGRPLYSLEIQVSRDRRHAIVRALGDLDGDGVLGTYEQAVEIGPGGKVVVAPTLKVTHEGE